ncbi:MAG TPA: FecR family protein [Chitinophagaceae bacterium]|nr:FecR family protein [Chitinophagaceae bacterium]
MKKSPVTRFLLERYLNDQCSPEEEALVEDWYSGLDKDFDASNTSIPAIDKEGLLEQIKQNLDKPIEPEKGAIHWMTYKKVFIGIAASLLIIAGVMFMKMNGNKNSVISTDQPSFASQFRNETNSISLKQLPDGSSVWMYPGATLQFNQADAKADRMVVFSGEGFFDVTKDAAHPFIIQTGALRTKVIGTSFNIRAMPLSEEYKVSVVTGKVQVSIQNKEGRTESLMLAPSQQASYKVSDKLLTQIKLPAQQLRREYWKPVTLSFEDENLVEVAKSLEAAFNINIKFSEKNIGNCLLTVSFNNQRLTEIIEMMETLLHVDCELSDDGKTLTIYGQGCS